MTITETNPDELLEQNPSALADALRVHDESVEPRATLENVCVSCREMIDTGAVHVAVSLHGYKVALAHPECELGAVLALLAA